MVQIAHGGVALPRDRDLAVREKTQVPTLGLSTVRWFSPSVSTGSGSTNNSHNH
ncbi:hypothetical protein SAMN04489712_107307 [Thermomonospora echinospora]|uniref:Uncharacterized protein n=1 Tax=Thermomonospora echinospora TaxID=1992 RepID=A0A1H6BPI7_9ACTN|nr:hypothetical protein SAMN04489712_107307 [Thermomonospora echinospora]